MPQPFRRHVNLKATSSRILGSIWRTLANSPVATLFSDQLTCCEKQTMGWHETKPILQNHPPTQLGLYTNYCCRGIRHDSPSSRTSWCIIPYHPVKPIRHHLLPGQPLNWCHVISPWFVFMLSQLLQDIWRGLHQSCWRNHGCGLWNLDAESSGSPGSYYHHIFLTPARTIQTSGQISISSTSPHVFLAKSSNFPVSFGYGSIPINTIFRGMNIHLPDILMFTRGTRFWHTAISNPHPLPIPFRPHHPWARGIPRSPPPLRCRWRPCPPAATLRWRPWPHWRPHRLWPCWGGPRARPRMCWGRRRWPIWPQCSCTVSPRPRQEKTVRIEV